MSPLSAGTFLLCALVAFLVRRAEQQGQAPQGGQSHHHIDGPGDPGAGSAADEGHKVEIEQADGAPVEAADNGQRQCELV